MDQGLHINLKGKKVIDVLTGKDITGEDKVVIRFEGGIELALDKNQTATFREVDRK